MSDSPRKLRADGAAEPAKARPTAPVLLCFDGSGDARAAIAKAGAMLAQGTAVVLTVWEPVASWAPYDPATILDHPCRGSRPARSVSTRPCATWRGSGWSAASSSPPTRVSGPRAEWRRASHGERSVRSPTSSTPRRSSWARGDSGASSRRCWGACPPPSSITRSVRWSWSRITRTPVRGKLRRGGSVGR
jgi:hypothetical protein